MKASLPLTILFCLAFVCAAVGQNPEEEILKNLALQETQMYRDQNLEGWRALNSQNAKTTRYHLGNGFYYGQVGWKPIDSLMNLYMSMSLPFPMTTIHNSHYVIEVADKLAWMVYDQQIAFENDSLRPTGTKEFRTFVKKGGQWKISSTMTIDTLSYVPSAKQEVVENRFNETGYSFLEENMINEAIEIFKLNVKLYPDAWNTYDSLGEAYAAAGNKKLAIENYQKSVELNPENENGKEWLAKLKK